MQHIETRNKKLLRLVYSMKTNVFLNLPIQ